MPPSRDRLLADIAGAADALTEPTRHVEQIPYWDTNRNKKFRRQETVTPSLLQHLADMAEPGAAPDRPGTRSIPASRPPLVLRAVSLLASISYGAAWRLHDNEGRPRVQVRATVEANIRAIVGIAPRLDSDEQQQVRRELRSWRYQAEIVVGWRSEPIAIAGVPCPAIVLDPATGLERECRARTLVATQDPARARCVECGAEWDENTIGELARHIAGYQAGSRASAEQVRAAVRAVKQAQRQAEVEARERRERGAA